MTRKRSKYRPRGVILDVMGFVKEGVAKLSSKTDIDAIIRIRANDAAAALEAGTATPLHIGILADVSNKATALKRIGKGQDWAEEIRAGTDAIEAIQIRHQRWGKVQSTQAEKEAISLLIRIHEAQLDDSTVIDMEKAISIAKKGVASLEAKA